MKKAAAALAVLCIFGARPSYAGPGLGAGALQGAAAAGQAVRINEGAAILLADRIPDGTAAAIKAAS
jgi:hypothetical protein